jgi:hypothetical protein
MALFIPHAFHLRNVAVRAAMPAILARGRTKLAVVIVVEEIGHDFDINDTKKVTKDSSA